MAKNFHLTFKGYLGHANYKNVLGMIQSGMIKRLDLYTELASGESWFNLRAGTAHKDNVLAPVTGECDVSLTNTVTASMGYRGVGFFEKPLPMLRVLGCAPHEDWLVLAVDRDKIDIDSFDDIANKKLPIKMVTQYNDGWDTVGYMVDEVFKANGFSSEDIQTWGGEIVRRGAPSQCIQEAVNGNVDAVFHEAIMIPPWKKLTDTRNMKFIPMKEEVVDYLEKSFALKRKVMPKGRLRGVDKDILTLSWSHWTLLVTDKLSDEIAYLIAQIMIEDAAILDSMYTTIPHELSAMDYPMTPEKVLSVLEWGIPLHPGAEKYYKEKGYLK